MMPDKMFVDMKDVVESYFKFINDPKGLNGNNCYCCYQKQTLNTKFRYINTNHRV